MIEKKGDGKKMGGKKMIADERCLECRAAGSVSDRLKGRTFGSVCRLRRNIFLPTIFLPKPIRFLENAGGALARVRCWG